MQTFLPYPDFELSARCLDNKRLGKQRIEALQILRTNLGLSSGWSSHPAVKMWKGYEISLFNYLCEICKEWKARGYSNLLTGKKMRELQKLYPFWGQCDSTLVPEWISPEFCFSHQSNLVRKLPEHYRKYFPDVPANLPYVWPK